MCPLTERICELLDPLQQCYDTAGMVVPTVDELQAETLPQPYRDLLAHTNDMTSTLEQFCGDRLHLRVLQKLVRGDHLLREVVLQTDRDQRAMEFGAIRIHLSSFPDAAREAITACQRPLGTILAEHTVAYRCQPSAFFAVQSDRIQQEVFGLTSKQRLYGRHSLLHTPQDQPLAEVVEILPQFNPPEHST